MIFRVKLATEAHRKTVNGSMGAGASAAALRAVLLLPPALAATTAMPYSGLNPCGASACLLENVPSKLALLMFPHSILHRR